ncbi:MAG: GFA family protein [bacterium]|nr:GFA family protein [bacterium]MCP5067173.1 GFA family protein [bacterium]
MKAEGGCYCGGLRYEIDGDPMFQGQCHCRQCQYISGGGPNYLVVLPEAGFRYSQGTCKGFNRTDLEAPVTREFCPECGTHILSRAPSMEGVVIVKVGTLDDPSVFTPALAIHMLDRQPFHVLPEGMAGLERGPGSAPVS